MSDKLDGSEKPKFSASREITLGRTGNAERLRIKNAKQRWVLGQMDMNRTWSTAELKAELGPFQEHRDRQGSYTYYFPDGDLTLFVAPTRNKVLTSRMGRVS